MEAIPRQKHQTQAQVSNADRIIHAMQIAGVERLFGMPGGGSGADLIAAAGRAGMPFSLAHTETGSAFMATAQAEITGKPGACLATLGPGAASLMNGVANAFLDRVPLIVLTDCQSEAAVDVMQHQTLRQTEMFSPVVKWSRRLRRSNVEDILSEAIARVTSLPHGPIHLDVSGEITSSEASGDGNFTAGIPVSGSPTAQRVPPEIELLLQRARRPAFLLGLGARTQAIAEAVRNLCERLGIPALVTYKAKGIVPDRHPWFGGVLTNGALERDVLDRADVFIAIGLDPVELLPRAWKFAQPVISITAWHLQQTQIPVASELVGDVVPNLQAVAAHLSAKTEWVSSELSQLVETQRERMRISLATGMLPPHRVVEIAAEIYPDTRATVDAGAFMFPVMSLWPAKRPCDVLISNGLATMGFALPAAIGASLLDKQNPTLAFTGDGGLLMCLGELRTAARESLPLRIIVFDDAALSLIKIKQIQQGYATDGVSIGEVDWEALGRGLGILAQRADTEEALRGFLAKTKNHPGPVLVAAKVDAETYLPTMRALRG